MKNLNTIINQIQKNKFLILGRAGVDIYPDPPGTKTENAKYYVSHLGGSSANIAVAITKLGGNCHLLTCLPNDALGRYIINQLNDYGVKTSLIKNLSDRDIRTSLAIIETTNEDHQSIIFRNCAADLFLSKDHIKNVNFAKFSCMIITGTSFALEPSRSATFEAIKLASKINLPIIMDVDFRPYTWSSVKEAANTYLKAAKQCDILIGNDEEFGVMAGKYDDGFNLAKQLSKSSSIIIYKMGERGSITFVENQKINTGVFKVKTLKPTGAGDAFLGGFVGSILNKNSINESLEYASAAAAMVVKNVGCSPAMPFKNELNNFLKNNNIIKYEEI